MATIDWLSRSALLVGGEGISLLAVLSTEKVRKYCVVMTDGNNFNDPFTVQFRTFRRRLEAFVHR